MRWTTPGPSTHMPARWVTPGSKQTSGINNYNDYNLDCSGAGAVYIRGMALGRSLKFHLDWEERQGQLEEARQVLERLQGRKVDDKVELVIKQSL